MILCLRTYDVSCRESLSAVLISAVEYRSKTLKCKTFHILGCINSKTTQLKICLFQLSRLRTLFGISLNDGVVGSDVVRRLRSELDEMQKDRDRLAEAEAKLRSEIQRESEARKEIESMWNEKAEIHKTETEKLSDKTRELEGQLQVSVKAMFYNKSPFQCPATSDSDGPTNFCFPDLIHSSIFLSMHCLSSNPQAFILLLNKHSLFHFILNHLVCFAITYI